MNFRLISKSPEGMSANPLMHYLHTHLQNLKSFGKASPIVSLEQLYKYVKLLSEKFSRVNPQAGASEPLVVSLRSAPCCGEELVVQQGNFNLTVKPEPHESGN